MQIQIPMFSGDRHNLVECCPVLHCAVGTSLGYLHHQGTPQAELTLLANQECTAGMSLLLHVTAVMLLLLTSCENQLCYCYCYCH